MLGLIRRAGGDEVLHPIPPSQLHRSEGRSDGSGTSSRGSTDRGLIEEALPRMEDAESPVSMSAPSVAIANGIATFSMSLAIEPITV